MAQWSLEERKHLVTDALRMLTFCYNTDTLSQTIKKWTMDNKVLSVCEEALEFSETCEKEQTMQASKKVGAAGSNNIATYTLFLVG